MIFNFLGSMIILHWKREKSRNLRESLSSLFTIRLHFTFWILKYISSNLIANTNLSHDLK